MFPSELDSPIPASAGPTTGSVYLDYAATTPVDPAVARLMSRFLTAKGTFGNPASSTHSFGRAAAAAVETAREQVAGLLSSRPDEIVWTSGATEAANLALKGAALARRHHGRHIVTSPLEHRAVLDSLHWLESRGFEIDYVRPDDDGTISPRSLATALRSDTVIVSLMLVNNETGTITDIPSLAPALRGKEVLLHVDAVQGAGRLPLGTVAEVADLITISGHKIYGPKGVGALRVDGKLRDELVPQIHGGGQEGGLRSGTLATHQIAGMGEAARLANDRRELDAAHVRTLDRCLLDHFERIPGVSINGSSHRRLPGIVNVRIDGVEAESLMTALPNIAFAAGSACTASHVTPSHVLLALGVTEDQAFSSVRFSFGRFTTKDDIDHTGRLVTQVVQALRSLAR